MAFPLIPIASAILAWSSWREWAKQRDSQGPGLKGLGLAADEPGVRRIVQHKVNSMAERVAWIRKGALEDSLDPKVVTAARKMISQKRTGRDGRKTWAVPEKDKRAEADAIFWAIKDPNSDFAIRYTSDHVTVDMFASTELIQRVPAEDCFVGGTKVLRDDYRLVAIENLRVGDRIWGKDRWSRVDATMDKGLLPTWRVRLNNGSSMRLTPGHKVWIQFCSKHSDEFGVPAWGKKKAGKKCPCAIETWQTKRIEVRELKLGHAVLRGEQVPASEKEFDPRRARIEGLYLSDGFMFEEGARRFAISGQDGCPKEEQKRLVEKLAAELGVKTSWHRKYISLFDQAWADRLVAMGAHAPEKSLLPDGLDINLAAARELFEGIMADSTPNKNGDGRTLTTTSRALFVQARVLAKILGIHASEYYLVEHGGLGTHPIWRLSTYSTQRTKAMKLLRVEEVISDGLTLPCYDITTDDHYVWLPEADWVTSQCDGFSRAIAAYARVLGFNVRFHVIETKKQKNGDVIFHIWPELQIGRSYYALDATENNGPGWTVDPSVVAKHWYYSL